MVNPTQYRPSGQVPTAGYGRPIGHASNEIRSTAWCDQPAKM